MTSLSKVIAKAKTSMAPDIYGATEPGPKVTKVVDAQNAEEYNRLKVLGQKEMRVKNFLTFNKSIGVGRELEILEGLLLPGERIFFFTWAKQKKATLAVVTSRRIFTLKGVIKNEVYLTDIKHVHVVGQSWLQDIEIKSTKGTLVLRYLVNNDAQNFYATAQYVLEKAEMLATESLPELRDIADENQKANEVILKTSQSSSDSITPKGTDMPVISPASSSEIAATTLSGGDATIDLNDYVFERFTLEDQEKLQKLEELWENHFFDDNLDNYHKQIANIVQQYDPADVLKASPQNAELNP